MNDFTDAQVGFALKQLGNYRVRRAQQVALEGPPDGISGAHLLSLGLRETGLRNINGGAVKDPAGRWVLPEPQHRDTGVFQISRDHHADELARMLGVKEGTWGPSDGHSALTPGMCPRFEEALRFTIEHMHEAQAYAEDHGIEGEPGRVRFAIAAHNAGNGGALSGYRAGDVDRFTAHGDYSAWVIRHVPKIKKWWNNHPGWKV